MFTAREKLPDNGKDVELGDIHVNNFKRGERLMSTPTIARILNSPTSKTSQKLKENKTSKRNSVSFRNGALSPSSPGRKDLRFSSRNVNTNETELDPEIKSISGLCVPMTKTIIFYCLCCTLIVPLLCFWSVRIRKVMMYSDESDLELATFALVVCEDGTWLIVPINVINVDDVVTSKMCIIRCKKYVLDANTGAFISAPDMPEEFTENYLLPSAIKNVATMHQRREDIRRMHGTNEIAIPAEPFLHLFLMEACDAFYVFQYFSCKLLKSRHI